MNEKLIINKLFKIAANQQKIIQKLAQAQQDPNIQYLKQAAQITAANSGFNATSVTVTANPGSTDTEQTSTIQVAGGYTVTVGGAPQQNELREKFIRQLRAMVATQKPNNPQLANLSVIFSG